MISFGKFDFAEKHQDSRVAIYSAAADTDTPGTRQPYMPDQAAGGGCWKVEPAEPETLLQDAR